MVDVDYALQDRRPIVCDTGFIALLVGQNIELSLSASDKRQTKGRTPGAEERGIGENHGVDMEETERDLV